MRITVRSCLALFVVALTPLLVTNSARAVPPPPLVVSADEGLAALALPPAASITAVRHPSRGDEVRVVTKLQALLGSLLRSQSDGTFSTGRRTQRRVREATALVTRLYRQLLNRQINPRRLMQARAASGGMSVFTLGAVVTAAGLSLDEDLTVDFTLGGKAYSGALTETYSRTTEAGASIQVDYSTLPSLDAINPSLFAALIRESTVPSTGVLVIAVFDSELPSLLAPSGLTNETVSNKAVTIPYSLNLTGSVAGDRTAVSPSVDDLYFAKENVLGIAAPQALVDQLAAALARYGG